MFKFDADLLLNRRKATGTSARRQERV